MIQCFRNVTRWMVTVFAPFVAMVFSWYWSNLPFLSATDVMSNYSIPLTETVFFSACCVVTHSIVCTLCTGVGNRRQCLLYVFCVVCYKSKFLLLWLGPTALVGLFLYRLFRPSSHLYCFLVFVICIKDRLPDRHSCLNLYPWVKKFSQSVSLLAVTRCVLRPLKIGQ